MKVNYSGHALEFAFHQKNWLIQFRFCIPRDTKWVISDMFFPANLLAYR